MTIDIDLEYVRLTRMESDQSSCDGLGMRDGWMGAKLLITSVEGNVAFHHHSFTFFRFGASLNWHFRFSYSIPRSTQPATISRSGWRRRACNWSRSAPNGISFAFPNGPPTLNQFWGTLDWMSFRGKKGAKVIFNSHWVICLNAFACTIHRLFCNLFRWGCQSAT